MPHARILKDEPEWDALWAAQKDAAAPRLLIFKKSPICPTSHWVEETFNKFIGELSGAQAQDLNIVSVDVVNQRTLSRKIAADTGVTHQSPQAVLIAPGGKVAWHASHGDVDEDALAKALLADANGPHRTEV